MGAMAPGSCLSTRRWALGIELAVLDPAEKRLAADAILAAKPEAAGELHVSPGRAEIGGAWRDNASETELRATIRWAGDEERSRDLNIFLVATPETRNSVS
jgi:hypothetical protein